MAAEPKGDRGKRWPAGAVAVAVALVLATLVADAIGGGNAQSPTVATTLGFPRVLTTGTRTTTGFGVTVKSPPTPAGKVGRPSSTPKRCRHGGPAEQGQPSPSTAAGTCAEGR